MLCVKDERVFTKKSILMHVKMTESQLLLVKVHLRGALGRFFFSTAACFAGKGCDCTLLVSVFSSASA